MRFAATPAVLHNNPMAGVKYERQTDCTGTDKHGGAAQCGAAGGTRASSDKRPPQCGDHRFILYKTGIGVFECHTLKPITKKLGSRYFAMPWGLGLSLRLFIVFWGRKMQMKHKKENEKAPLQPLSKNEELSLLVMANGLP